MDGFALPTGLLPAPLAGLTYAVPVFAAALLTATLAGIAWRYPRRPGRRPFILLMGSVTIWSGAYGIGLVTATPGWRLFLEQIQWVGIAFVPVWWLLFALEYSGLEQYISRRMVLGLSVIPIITIVLAFTNPVHRLFWESERLVVTNGIVLVAQEFGAWYLINLVFAYTLFGIGALLMIRLAFSYDALYMDQSVALSVGAIVPFAGNALSNLGFAPLPGLDLTPYTFAVTGLGFGLAIFRFELFGLLPMTRQIGRDMAVADLAEGIVIVDAEGHVVDANRAAWRAMGETEASMIGQPISSLLDDPSIGYPEDLPDELRFETDRIYHVSASTIQDSQDRRIGHAIVLRDVTEQRLREQRLEVQNRVLRHNLRNELNVIQGNLELIAEESPEAVEDNIDRIRRSVDELISLSNRAQDVETITESEFEATPVNLPDLVRRVTSEIGEAFTGCQIEIDVPPGTGLVTKPPVLDIVLRQLLRNAAEHGGAARPEITVTASEFPAGIELTVTDNGPGIPQNEIEVLAAEAETPLDHGSGMGLWVVKWGTQRLGGEVTFDEQADGTVVTLTVPDQSGNQG